MLVLLNTETWHCTDTWNKQSWYQEIQVLSVANLCFVQLTKFST